MVILTLIPLLVISPITDEESKDLIINRINEELESSSKNQHTDITVTIGVSEYPHDARSLDALLDIADQNMYKHKFQKRNNTEIIG